MESEEPLESKVLEEVIAQRLSIQKAIPNFMDTKFKEQCSFVADLSKLKAAFTTRRGAKSYSGGLHLIRDAYQTPNCNCLYLALTRENARAIMWKDVLKDIDRRKSLEAVFNETRLTMTLPNEAVIYVGGADSDEEEMDKLLGRKYKTVVIDESQAWHVDMRRLVYGILKPAVADYRGTICLLGTAGNITQGLFYDVTRQDGKAREPGWSVHEWTAYQNPYVAEQWDEEIQEIKRTRPLFLQTSLYSQWYLNKWVVDTTKLVYWYMESRNDYQRIPHYSSGDWQYVLGVDLGYRPDPSAFTLVAFHEHDRNLYCLESTKQLDMDVTDVANRIKEYQARFPIFKVVIDGSNKQAVQEMQNRHGVALTAADKRGKSDFIELLNAEFVQGYVKIDALKALPLKEEWQKLVWATLGDKILFPRKEHPGLPNHCSDSFLYAWRFCYQYLSQAAPPKIDYRNKEQYIAHTKKLMDDALEKQIAMQKAQESDEDFWAIAEMDDDDNPLSHYLNKRKGR